MLLTESIIQLEAFHKDFCIFDIITVQIDSNASSISLSLVTVSAFECEKKVSYFLLPSLSIFFSTKTNIVTTSLMVSDNLCKVFGCIVITDFISTIFRFSKDFG